jgi:hypothetical protein
LTSTDFEPFISTVVLAGILKDWGFICVTHSS